MRVRAGSRRSVGARLVLRMPGAPLVRLTLGPRWRRLAVIVPAGAAPAGPRLVQMARRPGQAFDVGSVRLAPLGGRARVVPRTLAVGVDTHLLRFPEARRRALLATAPGLIVRESTTWGSDGDGPASWAGWSTVDGMVADIRAAGDTLLPVLKPGGPLGDEGIERYAAWVGAFCDRYATPLIEIDNEPWNPGEWGATPERYADEIRAVATVLAGRSCRILVSADLVSGDGSPWAAPLLAAAPDLWSRPAVAGWSVHPYSAPYAPDADWLPARWRFARYRDVLALADRYSPGKPAYLTELGWTTGGAQPVTEAAQAAFTTRALDLAAADPRVAMVAVYDLHSSPGDAPAEAGFALTRADGSPTPALAAVRRASDQWGSPGK
jgi:hypothetical protein